MNSFLKQGLREKWVIRFVDVSGGGKQNGRTTKDNFREIRYVCVAIMPSPPTQHHIRPSSSCICYHLGKTQCSILHASSFNLRKCQTPGEEIWIIRQDDTHTWNSLSICNKLHVKQKMQFIKWIDSFILGDSHHFMNHCHEIDILLIAANHRFYSIIELKYNRLSYVTFNSMFCIF